jgi:HlyD family secretion protein
MTANVSVVVAQRINTLRVPNNALRVRLPDVPPPARAASAEKDSADAKPAARMATDEERRALMREAGYTPGGPPTPEVITRVRQLAAERGLELPARGGGRSDERTASSDAPVTRILYRLIGTGPTARPEAVEVKLGISDGTQTEVISGLAEGDRIITSVSTPTGSTAAPSTNPFGGGRRF